MKKKFLSSALALVLSVGGFASGILPIPGATLTASAATKTSRGGGRWDITLGYHNQEEYIYAKQSLFQSMRVEMYDVNWNLVWATNFIGNKDFTCGTNVYTVVFYVDTGKTLTLTW